MREAFCAVLSNGPLIRGDAIVVLSGDGDKRLAVGLEVLTVAKGAPLVVVSGGLDRPPHSLTAQASAEWLIDKGLAPDRIVQEAESQHTRGAAEEVIRLALTKDWKTLLIATSPYHQYRAFLTFVQALQDVGKEDAIQLVNIPASQTRWWGKPDGTEVNRVDLLVGEFEKIDEYRAKGHVASYEDGLAYLEFWEKTRRDAA